MMSIYPVCVGLVLLLNQVGSETIPDYAAPPLHIAAFNIQVFGKQKMSDRSVVQTLVKILSRYDIIVIQEIRDTTESAFPELVSLLNEANVETAGKYDKVVSPRLGRTSSKEQYGFIYRTDVVSVAGKYLYSNPRDIFQRPPFAVKFQAPGKEVETFALMVIHTEPDRAVAEIDALVDVNDELAKLWKTKEILIGGDFNADCNYVKPDDWSSIRLFTDKRFHWLIDNCVDTTTKTTDCSYDRFVTAGPGLLKAVVKNSGKTFRFDTAYELDYNKTIDVSDHYPIELKLEGKANRPVQSSIQHSVSYSVSETGYGTADAAKVVNDGYFQVKIMYDEQGRLRHVRFSKSIVRNLKTVLTSFRVEFPGILSANLISGALALEHTLLNPTYVYGSRNEYYKTLDVNVYCDVFEAVKCTVTVFRRALR